MLFALSAVALPNPVQCSSKGASGAYASLFREHYGRVVRWLSVLGVSQGDVDDQAQEVFIIAHRKLHTLRPDASPAGWLMAISRRVSATHRRGRARAAARLDHVDAPVEAPDPEAVAMKSQAAALLQRFLVSLPEEQRLVFALYEMDGFNATEVATTLDIPSNTVHSRVRLIREKLARFVARHRAQDEAKHG